MRYGWQHVGRRYLTENRSELVLSPEVALGRASGESGCGGLGRGRSESLAVREEWTGLLASGSSVWPDRRGLASAPGLHSSVTSLKLSRPRSPHLCSRGDDSLWHGIVFG